MKVCIEGHLTGTKACVTCGNRTSTVKGPSHRTALSKKDKAAITNAIRKRGIVPVKDL